MRKFACAAVLTLAAVGIAVADEFQALITKVDATKGTIEYKKYSGKGKDKKLEDTVHKANVIKGATVTQNSSKYINLNLKDKTFKPVEEEVAGGLGNELFSKNKGVDATLTTANADVKDKFKKGDVTKIHVGGGLGEGVFKTDK